MPQPIRILVLFHGMTPERGRWSPYPAYHRFWQKLKQAEPGLSGIIHKQIGIQWGHPLPGQTQLRNDEKLRNAQLYIEKQVAYDNVKSQPGPNNIVMQGRGFLGLQGRDHNLFRKFVVPLREHTVIHGLGDVIYYTSSEGEKQVRKAAYGQILKELEPYRNKKDVRIHVFGHSLGVTIAHDFLYGLFAPRHEPDFISQSQGNETERKRYKFWRQKAKDGELTLRSFASAASQLPLFVQRKPVLIDRLSAKEKLDPNVIGLRNRGHIMWKIFYDADDLLGFATRRLYLDRHRLIQDVQIDCGDRPDRAHVGYWENETVIRETAKMIYENEI